MTEGEGTWRTGVWSPSERSVDACFAGLDVFTRPASPGLQLLPWRESSLDGLGASGKVRDWWAAAPGKGGASVCVVAHASVCVCVYTFSHTLLYGGRMRIESRVRLTVDEWKLLSHTPIPSLEDSKQGLYH